jgi:hypothetical protein
MQTDDSHHGYSLTFDLFCVTSVKNIPTSVILQFKYWSTLAISKTAHHRSTLSERYDIVRYSQSALHCGGKFTSF